MFVAPPAGNRKRRVRRARVFRLVPEGPLLEDGKEKWRDLWSRPLFRMDFTLSVNGQECARARRERCG